MGLYAAHVAQIVYAPFRRAKADVWQTIAGWIWVAYITGLVVAILSMTA